MDSTSGSCRRPVRRTTTSPAAKRNDFSWVGVVEPTAGPEDLDGETVGQTQLSWGPANQERVARDDGFDDLEIVSRVDHPIKAAAVLRKRQSCFRYQRLNVGCCTFENDVVVGLQQLLDGIGLAGVLTADEGDDRNNSLRQFDKFPGRLPATRDSSVTMASIR